MRLGQVIAPVLLLILSAVRAEAFDFSRDIAIAGYIDLRLIAPPDQVSWLKGGLGKFRFGPNRGNVRFVEGVLQADAELEENLHVVAVVRGEPDQRTGIDALEAYIAYRPKGGDDLSWSVKTGAFFPTISLENTDLGWASPYTLTPSAINTWIGEEFRTIGSEATVSWHSDLGDLTAMGALYCCNEPAGALMFNRGWAMDDRPTGLLERVALPYSTIGLDGLAPHQRTSEFQAIAGRVGWYAGLSWQIPRIAKISLVRYDNNVDAAAHTGRDSAWATQFWSVGARSQFGQLVLISQWMTGSTLCIPAPGAKTIAYFDSAFLLASYDIGDWRLSLRQDWFEERHPAVTVSPFDEDGHALTMAASWSPYDWLRLTGELIVMNSRRNQYVLDGSPTAERTDNQLQLSTRFFF
jgi:hypothetical protein